MTTEIDLTRPFMIEIGNDVQITKGVTILTHGYDWAVLKGVYGDVLGSAGKVTIGNNVFIGMNSTILKGVTIGDNVIIGANSLVNKDIPSNSVAVGNPVHVVMGLDEYYKKRKSVQEQEAADLINTYYQVYHELPQEKHLHEFFWLFSDNPEELAPCYQNMMKLVGNESYSNAQLRKNNKRFSNLDSCINSLLNK